MSWYWNYRYTPRKPKSVKGGIKAQSKKGEFGENWWAKRWNQTLEEYNIGARLNRGRIYARKGQVKSIKIQKGRITAAVQGSWEYNVHINITMLTETQWSDIVKGIFESPVMAATLLAGQMPNDIEDVFKRYNISLFPKHKDISTECTCPDWANPCKHIAAVYLLLAEEFDRDPFLIFRLRGIERKEILKMSGIDSNSKVKKEDKTETKKDKTVIKKTIAATTTTTTTTTATAPTKIKKPTVKPIDPNKFWGDLEEQILEYSKHSESSMNAQIPTIPAVLLKQIGIFPFWRGEKNFMDVMEEIYTNVSKTGTKVFLGEYTKKSTKKDK